MSKVVKKVMVIDALMAGVSGDMFVGALLDAGADPARVVEAMRMPKEFLTGCRSLEIEISDTIRRGLHAKRVEVRAEEEVDERTGAELIEAATNSLNNLRVSEKAKEFVMTSVITLINAEARVHRKAVEEVHLHEAASVDTLADIIGSAVALEDLGIFAGSRVYSTPIAVGGGLLRFSHGVVSSPAPATIEILRSRGFPMVGGPVEAELATPTGVSLVTSLAHEFTRFYPRLKPTEVGYGAGSKDFPEMPNVVRITLGESFTSGLLGDEIYVLESNLDDATGEIVGHAVDRLLQEGARDVCLIPIFTKKNRPAQIIKVMADRTNVEDLARVLVDETGTLGVRIYPCERRILVRESVSVEVEIDNIKERIDVKVARDSGGMIIKIKPEYDHVKRVAERTAKPLREIVDIAKKRARESLIEE
ncbi:nickel pincer cofactor biosynthesis protein LarC [Chloroflexota bacterium]